MRRGDDIVIAYITPRVQSKRSACLQDLKDRRIVDR